MARWRPPPTRSSGFLGFPELALGSFFVVAPGDSPLRAGTSTNSAVPAGGDRLGGEAVAERRGEGALAESGRCG